MHYQHAFKWTNSGWTLCVMLCCVCWQLAHHNHHVSLPWLGVLLKCLHTLSLYAHVSFAAVTDSISEGLLPHSLHLLRSYYKHVPWRVLFSMFPACYLSCCYVFIPCITAAGGVPKSRITPPSQTIFLSPFAIDISVPGRIKMVVWSNQWLERY